MLPGSGVKLCVGRRGDVARDAEQGTEGVERIEPPVEAEGEFVEVGVQVLVTDPVMDAVQPRFQVCEDEMDDWQILLGDLRIAPFSDGEVFVAALGKAGVAAPVVGDERRARDNGALNEAAPFTELNRLLDAQLKGKTFPDKADAPAHVTVHKATVAASGDRLLISLKVKAKEEKSWFGLDADAYVFVWGKPVLDSQAQILRFTDLNLDVSRKASSGWRGPLLAPPFPMSKARSRSRPSSISSRWRRPRARASRRRSPIFQKQADGVKVEASVTGIRLAAIEFDAKTLRVIAEVEGAARAAVTKLP